MVRSEVIEEAKEFTYESLKDAKTADRFIKIYKFLYNVKTYSGCKDKINGYFAQFKSDFIFNIKTELMNENFVLKQGVVLRLPRTSINYTNANITDEIAIALLKQVPQWIEQFEKYPAGYQQKSLTNAANAPSLSDLKDSVGKVDDKLPDDRNSTEALKKLINGSASPTHIKALAEKGDRHVKRAATMRLKKIAA